MLAPIAALVSGICLLKYVTLNSNVFEQKATLNSFVSYISRTGTHIVLITNPQVSPVIVRVSAGPVSTR